MWWWRLETRERKKDLKRGFFFLTITGPALSYRRRPATRVCTSSVSHVVGLSAYLSLVLAGGACVLLSSVANVIVIN